MGSMARTAAGTPAAVAAAGRHRPRHVLAIDDSPDVLALLRDVLETEGFRVTTSAAPVAPAEVARLAPDIVLLDVLFGREERGLEVLRRLREEPATAATPVVLCSGATEPIRRLDAPLLEGATGLVLKPFDVDALLDEIARVLPDPA
jgi:CheY-like chemotaxis protein